jgi:hypothetical protein
MNNPTFVIVLGVIVVLVLFGFFLRRVSKEQSSVENLAREFASMEREQRLKETAALKELKKSSGQ